MTKETRRKSLMSQNAMIAMGKATIFKAKRPREETGETRDRTLSKEDSLPTPKEDSFASSPSDHFSLHVHESICLDFENVTVTFLPERGAYFGAFLRRRRVFDASFKVLQYDRHSTKFFAPRKHFGLVVSIVNQYFDDIDQIPLRTVDTEVQCNLWLPERADERTAWYAEDDDFKYLCEICERHYCHSCNKRPVAKPLHRRLRKRR